MAFFDKVFFHIFYGGETMKSLCNKVMIFVSTFFLNTIAVFAVDTSNRTGLKLLLGILEIIRSFSWVVIAFAIGMFLFSLRDQNAPMKSSALKIFGVGIFMNALLGIAHVVLH